MRRSSPSRLTAVVLAVGTAGLLATFVAAASLATSPAELGTLLAVLGLLGAAVLVDRFPVPIDGVDTGGISLLFVFCVAATVLFGWQAGVLVGFVPALLQVTQHRPPVRVLYNASVLALSGAAAGVAALPFAGESPVAVVAAVAAAGLAHYLVNLTLVSAVVGVSSRRPLLAVARSSLAVTLLPFGLMASAALILVVLWQRSPLLSASLVGPLLAIALYQRSNHEAMRAMRLALTDPLTGLGNHRHFHDRLERELATAHAGHYPLSLCLVDVDDFKRINDRYGHPAGDEVLAQIATRLRQGGESFRLGGDEFAVVLSGRDEVEAEETARAIVSRIGAIELGAGGSVTVSAGIAVAHGEAVPRTELVRRADSALYWAKADGKDTVRAWRADVLEVVELERLATSSDRAARVRAAAALARALDARDGYSGSHSERVAELAARLATRLRVPPEHVELTRLAARLHDLGKLAIPEEILRKPGPLSAGERVVLERHPQIAFEMLESLDVECVADWVLRHHERWDGAGYPDGLPATSIPLSARIIFVADAYDAMTSDRSYRPRLTRAEALRELQRCAASQFDPEVVAALVAELADAPADDPGEPAAPAERPAA